MTHSIDLIMQALRLGMRRDQMDILGSTVKKLQLWTQHPNQQLRTALPRILDWLQDTIDSEVGCFKVLNRLDALDPDQWPEITALLQRNKRTVITALLHTLQEWQPEYHEPISGAIQRLKTWGCHWPELQIIDRSLDQEHARHSSRNLQEAAQTVYQAERKLLQLTEALKHASNWQHLIDALAIVHTISALHLDLVTPVLDRYKHTILRILLQSMRNSEISSLGRDTSIQLLDRGRVQWPELLIIKRSIAAEEAELDARVQRDLAARRRAQPHGSLDEGGKLHNRPGQDMMIRSSAADVGHAIHLIEDDHEDDHEDANGQAPTAEQATLDQEVAELEELMQDQRWGVVLIKLWDIADFYYDHDVDVYLLKQVLSPYKAQLIKVLLEQIRSTMTEPDHNLEMQANDIELVIDLLTAAGMAWPELRIMQRSLSAHTPLGESTAAALDEKTLRYIADGFAYSDLNYVINRMHKFKLRYDTAPEIAALWDQHKTPIITKLLQWMRDPSQFLSNYDYLALTLGNLLRAGIPWPELRVIDRSLAHHLDTAADVAVEAVNQLLSRRHQRSTNVNMTPYKDAAHDTDGHSPEISVGQPTTDLSEGYGRYWCSTDKKWKNRQGPKQTRVSTAEEIAEAWSKKYKKSIDCSHPRGFSQRAHCAARRKRRAGGRTKSRSLRESIMTDHTAAVIKQQLETAIKQQKPVTDHYAIQKLGYMDSAEIRAALEPLAPLYAKYTQMLIDHHDNSYWLETLRWLVPYLPTGTMFPEVTQVLNANKTHLMRLLLTAVSQDRYDDALRKVKLLRQCGVGWPELSVVARSIMSEAQGSAISDDAEEHTRLRREGLQMVNNMMLKRYQHNGWDWLVYGMSQYNLQTQDFPELDLLIQQHKRDIMIRILTAIKQQADYGLHYAQQQITRLHDIGIHWPELDIILHSVEAVAGSR